MKQIKQIENIKTDNFNSNIEALATAYYLSFDKKFIDAKQILKTLLNDLCKLSYADKTFLIFTTAEYIRLAQDKEFFIENKSYIEKISLDIISKWNKPRVNIFSNWNDKIHTSNIAFAYGALYTINLFMKNDEIAKEIKAIREYVFKNNIYNGMLTSYSKGSEISSDLVLSVVPFGLFSPEDLVLVEAINEIEKQLLLDKGLKRYVCSDEIDNLSTLIMSWYFAEKGDYEKSKMYLSMITKDKIYNEQLFKIIYLIVYNKLKEKKALVSNPVIHKPLGNENRYEHQKYEREPWFPAEQESVIVRCVTWPQIPVAKVALEYWVNDEENKQKIYGEYMHKDNGSYWEFNLGQFSKRDMVKYHIFLEGEEDSKTESFQFEVLGKEYINKITSVEKIGNDLLIKGLGSDNRYIDLELSFCEEDFILNISTKDNDSSVSRDNIISSEYSFDDYKVEIDSISSRISILKNNQVVFDIESVWWLSNSNNINSLGITCKSKEDEGYYGFGERYNNLNQKGNIVDVYVYNQYKDQGIRTYFPQPYFLSSKNYGVYVNTPYYTEFDLEKTETGKYSIKTEYNSIEVHVMLGNPKKVINKYVNITGKPIMLPEWAFGPWMSSNNWDSDMEVRKQVELTKKYDIPSTALVIEAWSDEATYYIFNDAVYEENDGSKPFEYSDFKFPQWGRWPDPKGLIEYLHDNDLTCILWQIPIIKYMNGLHHLQKDADEKYVIEQGYSAKNEDGTPYRMPEGWFTDSILMDFTNPEAVKWWFDRRKYLVEELGVDGFKTDGGEFVFGDNVKFKDGRTGKEMRNLYPNLYIKEYYDFINKYNKGITFSRAGYVGAQTMPCHWAGDERSTFDAFKRNLCSGINAGISGTPFWGWDLAGFSGEIPTAELFIRSTAMAAFCPIMQYHAESKAQFNQDRTPWNIAERTGNQWAIDYYRFFAKLRMNLIPYIKEEAVKCVETGVPLMKAMFIEFPQDKVCWNLVNQYMFGEYLLVAPIIEEGEVSRNVYLPEGKWLGLFDNKTYEGKQFIEVRAELNEIPVFIRDNCPWKFKIDMKDGLILLKE